MDYKTRFPNLPRWTDNVFDSLNNPIPFIDPGFGRIIELQAPDNSTCFLGIGSTYLAGSGEGDEGLIYYLLEAPRNCPMRKAFELGKISYDDFIGHRGWLIRLQTKVMSKEDPIVTYIHPQQLSEGVGSFFKQFEPINPYQRLYDGLVFVRNFNHDIGEEYKSYDKRIEDFLRDHGEKLAA